MIANGLINNEILNNLPMQIGIKDSKRRYCFVNKSLLALLGFDSADAMLGRTDEELSAPCSALAEQIAIFDQHVLQQTQAVESYFLGEYESGQELLFGKSFWQYSEPDGEKLLIHTCNIIKQTDIPTSIMSHIACRRIDTSYVEVNDNFHKLSKQEFIVTYCLMTGATCREIAELMGLSRRTVEGYVQNVHNKWATESKSQLIMKARSIGITRIIPRSLLSFGPIFTA